MQIRKSRLIISLLGLLTGTNPSALGGEWDQRTVVTFGAPVEIPGQVLQAGTYIFRLADSQSNRNLVQIFSEDERHIYATLFTVPDERLKSAETTIITFNERTAGSLQAIKSWFYPGETYGHDFIYPKRSAVSLVEGKINHKFPSTPPESAPAIVEPEGIDALSIPPMHDVQVPIETPTKLTVAIPLMDSIEQDTGEAQSNLLPSSLPVTASNSPLVGLIGLLSLGTAALVKFSAAHTE